MAFATLMSACQKTDNGAEKQPQALAAPQNLKLTSCTANSASIAWDKVQGATRYIGRLEYTDGSLVPSGQKNALDETITYNSLEEGVSYRFKVRAKSEELDSEYSKVLEFTTGKSDVDPEPPSDDPGTGSESYAKFKISAHEDAHAQVLAFPGAEGGGMYTTGGRGGRVIRVTNLEDSGEGSFRAAITASGPRTIVFDVAGVIHLKSNLDIKNGDLTIAGQTAPGDGICISDQTVQIKCDNVIIRYMRFRLGDKGELTDGSDAIWGRYQKNIILDHCSISWAVDECASFYANNNFTMQWCFITEALRESAHSKGNHGYGGIWGGKNASFHHNMLAHNDSRNPRIDHPGVYQDVAAQRGNVDLRNNVIYNWGSNSCYGGEDGHFNMVGNYYLPGPGSTTRNYFVDAYWYNSSNKVGTAYPQLYMSGNHHAKASNINGNNAAGIYYHDQSSAGTNPKGVVLESPLPIKGADGKDCYVTTHQTAEQAFNSVLAYGGASLDRDAVDARIATEAKDGTATYTGSKSGKKGIIDSQEDVGGWPEYFATEAELKARLDSDSDGMPDSFEEEFGLNKNSSSDASTKTLDEKGRYTNLEMYLHYLVCHITEAQNNTAVYTKQ